MNSRRRHGRSGASRSKKPQPRTAREIAYCVLDEHFRTDEFAGRLLERLRATSPDSESEFRLATELSYGVIRRQSTLNAIIEPHVSRPRHKIEGPLWTLLQLGAYQLIFTDSIPEHAAVNETVSVATKFGNRGWSGFVNGVLRSIARDVTDEFTDAPTANAVPLNSGRYRRLSREAFADPNANPARYFARAFSFPQWIAERWQNRLSFAELVRLGFWFNTPPRICLRVNRLQTTAEAVIEQLTAQGVAAKPGFHKSAVQLDGPVSVPRLSGFDDGGFTVQDNSAMRVAEALNPQPGETVLDLCAAPGTKTTHIAELMQNQGRIVATDIKTDRLRRVTENAERLKLTIIESQLIGEDLGDVPAGPFDAVLVDAPCSNTGVLAKRPEARWRLSAKELAELTSIQKRLLTVACERAKPNGRVVYSTCSIEPEENGELVRSVLAKQGELRGLTPSGSPAPFQISVETESCPGDPCDGGYFAVIGAS